MRLIDADEVHELIDISCNRRFNFKIDKWSLHAMVEDVRTVDAFKHGHWEFIGEHYGEYDYKCSTCGEIKTNMPTFMGDVLYGYCPYCGAKMDEKLD